MNKKKDFFKNILKEQLAEHMNHAENVISELVLNYQFHKKQVFSFKTLPLLPSFPVLQLNSPPCIAAYAALAHERLSQKDLL